MTQQRERGKPRGPKARGQTPRPWYMPATIDYTCKRCGLTLPSKPLSPDPRALRVYGMPEGWELGSALEFEGTLARSRPEDEDYCLCTA